MFSGRRFMGTSKGEKDIYWSNVSMLLHGEGSNNGTTFTDSSANAHVATRVGNVVTSTTQYKFGTASIYSAANSDYLTFPDSASLNFGTGDFTIECWIRRSSASTYNMIYSKGNHASTGWVQVFISNERKLGYYSNDSYSYTTTATITNDVWAHVAISRSAGQVYGAVNGVVQLIRATDTTNITSTGVAYVGGRQLADLSLYGYMDELRITKGVARYTANFTPPTAAFPNG